MVWVFPLPVTPYVNNRPFLPWTTSLTKGRPTLSKTAAWLESSPNTSEEANDTKIDTFYKIRVLTFKRTSSFFPRVKSSTISWRDKLNCGVINNLEAVTVTISWSHSTKHLHWVLYYFFLASLSFWKLSSSIASTKRGSHSTERGSHQPTNPSGSNWGLCTTWPHCGSHWDQNLCLIVHNIIWKFRHQF